MTTRTRAVLAAAAVVATFGLSTPASSAAPKLPAGCTFNAATGTTTCVKTTTSTRTEDTLAYSSQSGLTDDGSVFADFCRGLAPGSIAYTSAAYEAPSTATITTTRTTTTTFQGAYGSGKKPVSTTTSTETTYMLSQDYSPTISCRFSDAPTETFAGLFLETVIS